MKFQHEIYLSEKEIGDLLWEHWERDFSLPGSYWESFRELKIYDIVPDFIQMGSSEEASLYDLDIFELKISANIDSVRQICKYRSVILDHISHLSNPVNEHSLPNVSMNLIARNIDNKIIELCKHLDISLWRVSVISRYEVEVSRERYERPSVPIDHSFIKQLESFYLEESNG